jgi:hypothetical protein
MDDIELHGFGEDGLEAKHTQWVGGDDADAVGALWGSFIHGPQASFLGVACCTCNVRPSLRYTLFATTV